MAINNSHTSTTTYTVTATSGDGCTGTDDVVVMAGTAKRRNHKWNKQPIADNEFSSDGDAGVPWTSSDDNIATVNSSGVVTGVAAGSVTITYSISNITFTVDRYLCSNDKQFNDKYIHQVLLAMRR